MYKLVKISAFIIIVCFTKQVLGQGYAKKNMLDSLQKELSKENLHDTTYINLLNEIGEQEPIFRISYWDTIISLSEKAINKKPNKKSLKSFRKNLGDALNNVGFLYEAESDIPKALDYFHKSLKIQEEIGDKDGIATSLNNIGFNYNNQGDIPLALNYYHKSLKIQEEIGNKRGIAQALNNIGGIYDNQGDFPQALSYYRKSLKIREEIEDKRGSANCLNNIGMIYNSKGDIPKALNYFHKSLKIQEEIGDKQGIAMSLNNIGTIHQKQSNLSKALEYYQKSLKIYEEIGNKHGIAHSFYNIGNIYLQQNKFSKAKKNGLKSLNLAQEIGYPETVNYAANLLSEIYEKQGKGMQALEMYQLATTMKDSINNETNRKTAVKQQAKYEYEKEKALNQAKFEKQQALSDKEHEKQMAIQKKEKEKQKVLTYSVGTGLFLVIGFLIFVFNRLRITKKQKTVIETQKKKVELAHKETEKQKEQVEEAHKEITDSINYAERIQRSFLASEESLDTNLNEHFVFFQPKDVVSGDFYWADKLSNGNFVLVNADSTGHGVPGAIMSILNISSIELAIERGSLKPEDIFNATRKTIIERLKKDGSEHGGKDGMDASIISFNADKTKMTYCAAQNPIWIIRNQEIIQIKPEKMPVGKHDKDNMPFVGGEIDLQKGDLVYTITDGFQDQFGGPRGKKFMVKRFREHVLSNSHLPLTEQHKKLKEIFADWKGGFRTSR